MDYDEWFIHEVDKGLAQIEQGKVPGRKSGAREVVLSTLPYIVVYQITGEIIHIARILHSAQKWP